MLDRIKTVKRRVFFWEATVCAAEDKPADSVSLDISAVTSPLDVSLASSPPGISSDDTSPDASLGILLGVLLDEDGALDLCLWDETIAELTGGGELDGIEEDIDGIEDEEFIFGSVMLRTVPAVMLNL